MNCAAACSARVLNGWNAQVRYFVKCIVCLLNSKDLYILHQLGIPHLIAPGCLDMVNFGPISTVPERYKTRQLYEWNPSVTLMRTNKEENELLGKILAEKANAAKGPVAFLLPLKGTFPRDALKVLMLMDCV